MLDFFGLGGLWVPAFALLSGTTIGFVVGLLPGIGGKTALVIFLPVAAKFDPYSAAIFLFALHSVTNTSSSIPNIALGVPTSGSDAATVLDGYPLTKMGRGGEALGASLSASAIGGVLGALAFAASIPVARIVVTSFGPPEIMMLAILGIAMVASLSPEGFLQGLAVTALGVMFAMVGLDGRTGDARFTFGFIELWDGVSLPALIGGLFVIPEMLTAKRHADHTSFERAMGTRITDVYRGMFVTLRYKAVLLRSTLYGILVGATPAAGSTVAVWISYAYAARNTKSEIPFGQGAIAGVIAPEAANNSKEGGAMIPTLFFSIPGSSGMAVMMAALAVVGVAVGPAMLTTEIRLSYTLAATVILANLIAIPMFFIVVPSIVRLGALRRETIAPIAVAISVMAALIDSPSVGTIAQLFVATVIGMALKAANWPRAPFVLGFVVAALFEESYFLTAQLWGWSALFRPITALLLLAMLMWLAVAFKRQPPFRLGGRRDLTIVISVFLGGFFATAFYLGTALPLKSGVIPMAVSVLGMLVSFLLLLVAWRDRSEYADDEEVKHIGLTGLFLLATPFLGLFLSTLAYVTAVLLRLRLSLAKAVAIASAVCAVEFVLLATLFDVLIEREIIGRLAWALLGY